MPPFLHFEDLAPGQVFTAGPLTVSREAMLAFAEAFDPQPFHLDEAAARASFPGQLIGSGWQTAALGMRLLADGLVSRASSMGSPGIDALRWLRPVLPGDALSARIRIEETRASASRPDRGFARMTMDVANAAGEVVMNQRFSVMFARRGVEPAPRSVAVGTGAPGLQEGIDAEDDGDAVPVPYLGDAEIGAVRELGRTHFDAASIIAFARAYDPQAFHLDAEAAARSHFGALCASGWHTAAAWMACLHRTRTRDVRLTA